MEQALVLNTYSINLRPSFLWGFVNTSQIHDPDSQRELWSRLKISNTSDKLSLALGTWKYKAL